MFGYRQRTMLPTALHLSDASQQPKSEERIKFCIGDKVRVQNPKTKKWDRKGVIQGISQSAKSFDIKTEEEGTIWRN